MSEPTNKAQMQRLSIRDWQQAVHRRNRLKGFYDYEQDIEVVEDFMEQVNEPLNTGVRAALQRLLADYRRAVIERKLLLVVGEICEAHEELRNGRRVDEVYYHTEPNGPLSYAKPEGFPIELADAHIRLLDIQAANGLDAEKSIAEKHEYNGTREHKHGRQF